MWNDPIVNEVRAAREAYSARFGHDLQRIARDLREKQASGASTPLKKRASAKRPARKPRSR